MNIHDAIFMLGGVVLTLAALPGLRGKPRTPLPTALGFTIVLGTFTINYLTMNFLLTAAISAAQTGVWCAIAWRVVRSGRTHKRTRRRHG